MDTHTSCQYRSVYSRRSCRLKGLQAHFWRVEGSWILLLNGRLHGAVSSSLEKLEDLVTLDPYALLARVSWSKVSGFQFVL